jgi:hypothetical protein
MHPRQKRLKKQEALIEVFVCSNACIELSLVLQAFGLCAPFAYVCPAIRFPMPLKSLSSLL